MRAYYTIFFVSGIPALIYQVVWQRVLTLYFGVDVYSASITVATFMLGLGVGSLVGGVIADRTHRPAAIYTGCELALAVFGAVSLPLFAAVGSSLGGSSLAVVISIDFVLLLLPTTTMGMTLPLMARTIVRADSTIGRNVSLLYGLNTLGAALGATATAYLLAGWLGLEGAVRVAVALNVLLAIGTFTLIRRGHNVGVTEQVRSGPQVDSEPGVPYALVLALSFASGFVALGYELVWYRVLGIILHGTVYVFGTVLAVFLTFMALGSYRARRRIDSPGSIERFAFAQGVIVVWGLGMFTVLGRVSTLPGIRHAIGASFFTSFHPAPELFSGLLSVRAIFSLGDIFFWSMLLIAVPAFAMGYGFPNLIRASTKTVAHLGRSVGHVYFSNIVGSTMGSLVSGFVLLDRLGSEQTLVVLQLLGAGTVLAVFLHRTHLRRRAPLSVIGGLIVVIPVSLPGRTQLYRALHYADYDVVEFHMAEDATGIVGARTQSARITFAPEDRIIGMQRIYIDGANHGALHAASEEVAVDRSLAMALSAHPVPARVLSIGLGDGRLCATALRFPDVDSLTVVELNASLHDVLAMTTQGSFVAASEKVALIRDDGRRWLLANPDVQFDVIMMWPLHAAHAFSGNLYSREFFEIIDHHLAPGGLVFARSVDAFSTARTIAKTFDHVVRLRAESYVASQSLIVFDQARLAEDDHGQLLQWLEADRDTILMYTKGVRINRDLRPNSEYYITYPHRSVLHTFGPAPPLYKTRDRKRLLDLVSSEPSRP